MICFEDPFGVKNLPLLNQPNQMWEVREKKQLKYRSE